jgi:hypothetical protein
MTETSLIVKAGKTCTHIWRSSPKIPEVPHFQRDSFIFAVMDGQAEPAPIKQVRVRK